MKRIPTYGLLVVLSIVCIQCTREVDLPLESSGEFIVIDAFITNELKHQEVVLSRISVGEGIATPETGAIIVLFADGNSIPFTEETPGVYRTENPFQAISGVTYSLSVRTSSGETFISTQEQLPPSATIERVYAVREFNDQDQEGMSIYLDGRGTTEEALYFQYDFEETFIVQPPLFNSSDLIVVDEEFCEVAISKVPRPERKRLCYRTQSSNSLNLLGLEDTFTNNIERHLVRFINRNRYEISYRYSINVSQLVISEGAFDYYGVLNGFVTEENVFSQVQPGFVTGNIVNEVGTSNNVVGYFVVASATSERIFFNYDDFFPGEPLPPFIDECTLEAFEQFPRSSDDPGCGPLITVINNGTHLYVADNKGQVECLFPPCPYVLAPAICGDCEVLGQSEPPPFWID